jgi:glycerol-3-phosphate dehydrogenase
MEPLPLQQRAITRQQLQQGVFDLVVIGGGINGAAIARDAALRGYSVALIEQGDYGCGTSSRSSRLIHGGLRYLEQGEIGLVFESVSERARLARLARHLVRPLPFVVPVYRRDGWPLTLLDIGLWIYDALALFRNHRNHEHLSASALRQRVPGLADDQLLGGVLYYDYQTNDARLVLENVLAARAAGARLLSYCKAEAFEYRRRRVRALRVRDQRTGESTRIAGRAFVCAAGPWTDQILAATPQHERWLRPTKGVHLVVPKERLDVSEALVLRHPDDRRVLFVLPHHERTVIGTTDTDYQGDPAAAQTESEDVRYLVEAANQLFPALKLAPTDVTATWCGVRPLLGADRAGAPSAVSRDHQIVRRDDGIIVIAGGKLTTHRKMAEECVDAAALTIGLAGGRGPRRGCTTHRTPLPGAVGLGGPQDFERLRTQLASVFGVDDDRPRHLAQHYGVRALQVTQIASDTPQLASRLAADLPFVRAEIVYAARHELVLTLSDLLIRRLGLFYRALDQGLSVCEEAAQLLAPILGWSVQQSKRQVEAYAEEVAKNGTWAAECI